MARRILCAGHRLRWLPWLPGLLLLHQNHWGANSYARGSTSSIVEYATIDTLKPGATVQPAVVQEYGANNGDAAYAAPSTVQVDLYDRGEVPGLYNAASNSSDCVV